MHTAQGLKQELNQEAKQELNQNESENNAPVLESTFPRM